MIVEEYFRVFLLLILSILFPLLPLSGSYLFSKINYRPFNSNDVKSAIYECGVESEDITWRQFNAKYFLYALGFVIFDVEVIFLFPWAVIHSEQSYDIFLKVAIFVGVLAFGLLYAWKWRALEWQ
ncbi:MAG: NADH-quinone oxidoreductase subunit A [Chloroflexi bacterium]|jgi:NADH-quinone oxidoreductase subunit A|nr:MAG: NADH-quinone oxidoreductase subunit A [Chloroflexota bacterium]|tara:strand:+ start:8968 stop:9342 length:375 start_codon:yes stop_codon:yes gene_type:complete